MKGITLLGSTGTIGINTLNVISQHPHRFRCIALTANKNVDLLFQQCQQYQPVYAVLHDTLAAKTLRQRLRACHSATKVLQGHQGLEEVASHSQTDIVVAGIVGAAGLLPTLVAAKAGKRVLLANKEALVMAGGLLMETVRACNATLLPVDSEHNAIFQCMPSQTASGYTNKGVKGILLTASGGPFRDLARDQLWSITPKQACKHPNWHMGPKISVDCATMMNKGLEVIEAYWLFSMSLEQIKVVIHPQSIVHSMVEYEDGSVLAQMSQPDMRVPIAHALAWPERIVSGVNCLDLLTVKQLDFLPVTAARYPCFELAFEALKRGGTATTILNAANEIAVQAFLDSRISFLDISKVIEKVLQQTTHRHADSLDTILAADADARQTAILETSNLKREP